MSGNGTVEWGEDRPVRVLDRLFGDAGGGFQRLSAPAVGAAIVATALFVAAELLPWMSVEVETSSSFASAEAVKETHDLALDMVGGGISTAYYVGLLLLLAVVGLVQASRPHTRRALTAAGFGLGAAMLVLLVGIIRRAGEGGQVALYPPTEASAGPGPYLAIAGVLVVVAALVVSGWRPTVPGRRPVADVPVDDDDDDEAPGPIDLTVTPA
jgi:hypothetical protein